MRKIIFFLWATVALAQSSFKQEALQPIPFGRIQPQGWVLTYMQRDLESYVGQLDQLVPSLFKDSIYTTQRLGKNTKAKDLGNLKSGDAAGDDQYKWWNSETQSNWWDGYIRHVFLTQSTPHYPKVEGYIRQILDSQDADGYLGIYDAQTRYNFQAENGEFWAKTTLLRGLIAYYEATGKKEVFTAIERAVANVMQNYPIGKSNPFNTGNAFNGGVSHGLTFTDVLDYLYQKTKLPIYRQYALFLYQSYAQSYQSESDAQPQRIQKSDFTLQGHGVHVYEHIRPLVVAAFTAESPDYSVLLSRYLAQVEKSITATGGPIGDEWIAGRLADATQTGYEYCSLQELLDSYAVLLQKTGEAQWAAHMEQLFFNAGLGARHPNHEGIAYLKTDNSWVMDGTRNGEAEPDRVQTRYKYSAVHQEVAVCCTPNAGRFLPYVIQNIGMQNELGHLYIHVPLPFQLAYEAQGQKVILENQTQYPQNFAFTYRVTTSTPITLTFYLRKPNWVSHIETNESIRTEGDYYVVQRVFQPNDSFSFTWKTSPKIHYTQQGEVVYQYGPQVYALSVASQMTLGRNYGSEFKDKYYEAKEKRVYEAIDFSPIMSKRGMEVRLWNPLRKCEEKHVLVPMAETVLRQVAFPKAVKNNG
ncbi:beta-L-arabinofuranosidase domain-containing protein [Flavobacterium sp.]|uniref:beta-L-arabinofuranosidase domain-containing protein n=1 Tax=Flavobacterium sp. TaxID=239 RepID=UPI002625E70B|nr:beta-L-arabinofuranosidase domain-containing protein [Flavobacterium sp.]